MNWFCLQQEMSDVYSTEPDTTQEDSQLQMNVHHGEIYTFLMNLWHIQM